MDKRRISWWRSDEESTITMNVWPQSSGLKTGTIINTVSIVDNVSASIFPPPPRPAVLGPFISGNKRVRSTNTNTLHGPRAATSRRKPFSTGPVSLVTIMNEDIEADVYENLARVRPAFI